MLSVFSKMKRQIFMNFQFLNIVLKTLINWIFQIGSYINFQKNVSLIIDDYINYARSVILGDDLISDYFLVTSKRIS